MTRVSWVLLWRLIPHRCEAFIARGPLSLGCAVQRAVRRPFRVGPVSALVPMHMSISVSRVFGLVVLALAGSSALASAQTSDPDQPARFETDVVVTAEWSETPVNQVPASVVVIGQAKLQTLPVVQPTSPRC